MNLNKKSPHAGALNVLVIGAVFISLLLAGCSNLLGELPKEGAYNSDGTTSVRVSIGNAPGTRTLIPSQNYTKYRLEIFKGIEPDTLTPHGTPVVLTGTNTKILELEPGDWTINAFGIVNIGGTEYAAAWGSATITLTANQSKPLPITVSASLDAANGPGFFNYTVNLNDDADISDAELNLSGPGSYSKNIDLLNTNPAPGDASPLALYPGFYLLKLEVHNYYGIAVRTEIVHIYSGLETIGSWTFNSSDFADLVKLSGKVDLTGFADITDAEVYFYNNDFGFYQWTGLDPEDIAEDNTIAWELVIPAFPGRTDLNYGVWIEYNNGNDDVNKESPNPIEVYNKDIANINLGPFNASKITLGGSINVSGINIPDVAIDDVQIDIFDATNPNDLKHIGDPVNPEGASWTTEITGFEGSTDLWVVLSLDLDNGLKITETKAVSALKSNIGNINFAPAKITTGSWIENKKTAQDTYGDYFLLVPDTSGTWELETKYTGNWDPEMFLYDGETGNQLESNDDGGGIGWNSRITWDLDANHAYIIRVRGLSGYGGGEYRFRAIPKDALPTLTISGTIALGDLELYDAEVRLYLNGYGYSLLSDGAIDLETGAWSIEIPGFETPTDVYVRFYYKLTDGPWSNINITKLTGLTTTSPAPINADPFAAITLGGTINLGDLVLDYAEVELRLNGYGYEWLSNVPIDRETGEWSIDIAPFYTPTDVYVSFYYELTNGSWGIINITKLPGLTTTSPAPINAGPFVILPPVTLSGTASILLNDDAERPFNVGVVAFQEGSLIGQTELAWDGTWTMTGVKSKGASPVSFSLVVSDGGDEPQMTVETGITETVSDQAISGISLGNITLQTAQVKGTVNFGATSPHPFILFALKAGVTEEEILGQVVGGGLLAPKVIASSYYGSSSGSWQLDVPSNVPSSLWFMVLDYWDGSIYVTTGAVNRNGAVTLNVDQMTKSKYIFID
jgi:hypothetical protein